MDMGKGRMSRDIWWMDGEWQVWVDEGKNTAWDKWAGAGKGGAGNCWELFSTLISPSFMKPHEYLIIIIGYL